MENRIQKNDLEQFNNTVSLFLQDKIVVEKFELDLQQYKNIINLVIEILILSNFLNIQNGNMFFKFPKFETPINIFYFPVLNVNLNQNVLMFDEKVFSKIVYHYKLSINNIN